MTAWGAPSLKIPDKYPQLPALLIGQVEVHGVLYLSCIVAKIVCVLYNSIS